MKEKNAKKDNNSSGGNVDIGKGVSGSVIVTGSQNTINVGDAKNEDPKKKTLSCGVNVAITVALIGMVGTVLVAMFDSSIIERLLFPTPAPSSTPTVYVSETPTVAQPVPASETPVIIPADTLAPTITASPTQQAAEQKMTVVFFGNPLDGKGPMRVNFNARESFVTLPDSSSIACGTTRLCHYTFKILLDGKVVEEDENTDGLYSYVFGKRGQYIVTVYVCRDETCGGSRVMVNVR
jgi:hypothetical protein